MSPLALMNFGRTSSDVRPFFVVCQLRSDSLVHASPAKRWARDPYDPSIFKASVGSIRITRRAGTMAASRETPIISTR